MSQFMQQNFLLYGMAVAGIFGVISQVILRIVYDKLIRDMEKPAFAKGKYMRHLKQRYNIYKRTQTGTDSINIFIQKSMMEYKYMGMNLHTWRRMGGYVFALCAALGAAGWYLGGTVHLADTLRQNYLWAILASALLIAGAYGVTDTGYRRKYLETGLRSLFTNSSTQAAQPLNLSETASGQKPDQAAEVLFEPQRKRAAMAGQEGGAAIQRRRRERRAAASPEVESGNKILNVMTEQTGGMEERTVPEPQKKRGKIIETKAQRDKRELKANLAKLKEGIAETAAAEQQKEKNKERSSEILRQMDPSEQERVIREVLKEFL